MAKTGLNLLPKTRTKCIQLQIDRDTIAIKRYQKLDTHAGFGKEFIKLGIKFDEDGGQRFK